MKKSLFIISIGLLCMQSCEKSNITSGNHSEKMNSKNLISGTIDLSDLLTLNEEQFAELSLVLDYGKNEFWDVLEDGKGTYICSEGNGGCYKSNKPKESVTPFLVSYIEQQRDLLDIYGTSWYFANCQWDALFSNLNSYPAYLSDLASGTLRIVPMPTEDEQIAAFVLTSAVAGASIDNSNTLMVWIY